MVTSTFVSFVFAKRFIEVEALYLQTQNSFAQLECDGCEPWAGLKICRISQMHGADFSASGRGGTEEKFSGWGRMKNLRSGAG